MTALIRVDFPAPFGPITRTTSPGTASTEMSRITGTAPYPAVTCRALSIASAVMRNTPP